ncbi:nuclear transport factor 2 family protein [Lacticaseibacillus saniviri]|uniref:SnoaL-like domain-containing protein n=1 Tax=Lacticaseibacillus saniviri JCM 17471 = DSM 24301 TaxID=1293598 RepID=A0A0R2MN72_9LACO|nr:hypothetical protein [Lacticaseibacillus saniviri]KRO15151.1 hypothetical protein IV56_GL000242 [Lacticaseibacillus saniviri JCM 17471 = DSM 24301]MCG4281144.1 hypothetical protein [Lacticaseibacillus saniviri]
MTDFEAISQLVLKERSARGKHQDAALADSYWDDATVTTSWSTGLAHDTFVGQHPVDFDYSKPMVGTYGTPLVYQNGSRAYVEVSSTTKHWVTLSSNEAIVESFMTLVYRVEKRGDVWKISDLTSINNADTLMPVIPGVDLNIDQELVAGLRVSYRWLAYTRIKTGGKIDNDGIGSDKPETVKPVYDKAEAWIK